MILNHRYRFIFIKTRKTAGSSAEIGLSRVCGPGDIVTALNVKHGEERLRREEGGYGPAGDRKRIAQHRGLREWRRLLTRGQRALRLRPHATALELRALVGEATWNDYYKFAIERNPWDKAVSRYWWQKFRREQRGRSGFPPMYEYLQYLERERPHWLSNWGHYTIDDRIAVDRVLLYEDLKGGIEQVRADLGLTEDIGLPRKRAKSSHRPPDQAYREVLGPAERDLVARVCAREIEAFGYAF